MPRAVALAVRQQILGHYQQGLPTATSARLLGLSPRTVRHLRRRFRHPAVVALEPHYAGCGRRCATPPGLRERCLDLRRQHAGWGAQRLRLALRQCYPGALLPATRTLQVWLDRAGLAPGRPRRPPQSVDGLRAHEAHQVWQVDAAEHIRLQSQEEVSWLRIVDECSGAVLATVLFPPGELAERPSAGRPDRPAHGLWSLGTTVPVARR